jgi:2-oxoglutarate dehydrogenase complex dehydrogenase (E1) component-like enzyme
MSNFNEIARKTDFFRGNFESENNLETSLEKKIYLLQQIFFARFFELQYLRSKYAWKCVRKELCPTQG